MDVARVKELPVGTREAGAAELGWQLQLAVMPRRSGLKHEWREWGLDRSQARH